MSLSHAQHSLPLLLLPPFKYFSFLLYKAQYPLFHHSNLSQIHKYLHRHSLRIHETFTLLSFILKPSIWYIGLIFDPKLTPLLQFITLKDMSYFPLSSSTQLRYIIMVQRYNRLPEFSTNWEDQCTFLFSNRSSGRGGTFNRHSC